MANEEVMSSDPIMIDRYSTHQVQTTLTQNIKDQFEIKNPEVRVSTSLLADLDHNGAVDDLVGTARLKVGRTFKSFVFLLREDGDVRLLENDLKPFSAKQDLKRPNCGRGRPGAQTCTTANEWRQALTDIPTAALQVIDFDPIKPGQEIVSQLGRGIFAYVNPIAAFAR